MKGNKGLMNVEKDGEKEGREDGEDMEMRDKEEEWKVSMLKEKNGREWKDIIMMKGEEE